MFAVKNGVKLKRLEYQIIHGPALLQDLTYPMCVGSHDEIVENTAKLPYGEYTLCAPFIGLAKRILGTPKPVSEYKAQLTEVIRLCLNELPEVRLSVSARRQYEASVQEALKLPEISRNIIYQLGFNIVKSKLQIAKYKDIFVFLAQNGASWMHLLESDQMPLDLNHKEVINLLVAEFFGKNGLNNVLANCSMSDPLGVKKDCYAQMVDIFLELGVDLNGSRLDDPAQGTFLHQQLSYESVSSVELITFLYSKRKLGFPHTFFNFASQDGEGKTPLMIAIATRNLKAAYKLLGLSRQSEPVDIGINLADNKGRTALMLAAAFGLPLVVQALLRNGADPTIQDRDNKIFSDYLNLPEAELREVVSLMVHPDRGNVGHSYLYCNDKGSSPYCLYEENEALVVGDLQLKHFIVLSPLPEHQARQQKVLEVLTMQCKELKKQRGSSFNQAETTLKFVKDQIGQIGKRTFLAECQAGQAEISIYLKSDAGQKELVIANSKFSQQDIGQKKLGLTK